VSVEPGDCTAARLRRSRRRARIRRSVVLVGEHPPQLVDHECAPPIITDGLPAQYPDIDEVETREWLESFDAVVDEHGQGARPVPAAQGPRARPAAATSASRR
jgi:hypothetical protein